MGSTSKHLVTELQNRVEPKAVYPKKPKLCWNDGWSHFTVCVLQGWVNLLWVHMSLILKESPTSLLNIGNIGDPLNNHRTLAANPSVVGWTHSKQGASTWFYGGTLPTGGFSFEPQSPCSQAAVNSVKASVHPDFGSLRSSKEPQLLNAEWPISVTESGIVTFVRQRQPKKA